MPQKTIVDAIKTVMSAAGGPMTAKEAYQAILEANLYTFRTDQPITIVSQQIRRHCEGIDLRHHPYKKYFRLLDNGKFCLLSDYRSAPQATDVLTNERNTLDNLTHLHTQYVQEFKKRVLDTIKLLDPSTFELFCRNLLTAYGFRETAITKFNKDGGIDGHGRLKVGFTYFSVAFQCKRWKNKTVGRPEINQFRGDIQGRFVQGIFFTTSNFSADAKRNSFVAGAVPVTLVNGATIVEVMIEKGFGVLTEPLPIFTLAMDSALTSEE
jgi:restriction system protein